MRRSLAGLAAACLLLEPVLPQQPCPGGQAWDAAAGGCAVCDASGVAGGTAQCLPGFAFNATAGGCTQCPEGKQSPGGYHECSYCRFTLRPTALQDGCECDALTFSMDNSTRDNPDVPCTPCADVTVHHLDGSQTMCQTTSARRACGKKVDGSKELPGDQADGYARCDLPGAACECSGGTKGVSPLCGREGYFLKTNSTLPGASSNDLASTVSLIQCIPMRSGKHSRCQHWSRCLHHINFREDDDDPYAGYIDDYEFATWLDSPEGRVEKCPHAENCCAPGFGGILCDYCVNRNDMKIGEACVTCDHGDINLPELVMGLAASFMFTLLIMHKASTTFEDANGTATIAIFYFQVVALMFKDRAAEFGWALVSLFSILELGCDIATACISCAHPFACSHASLAITHASRSITLLSLCSDSCGTPRPPV